MREIFLTPKDNLQSTVNSLNEPTVVHLSKGVYYQKTEILKSGLTIVGEGEDTVITYDDYARKIHSDGKEYNTFRTYTLAVCGDRVKLSNLTIENSNSRPEQVGQCVALSVHAKEFYAENVTLKSTQDTLFLAPFPEDLVIRYAGFIPHRQLYMEGNSSPLFRNCKIYGTVDFIFGGASAYFKNCELISLADNRGIGYVCAPSHSLAQSAGFNFIDCKFLTDGAAASSCALARPWRDFGKCAFINCELGEHIDSRLFDKWNDTSRDKTARFLYYNLKAENKPEPVKWAKLLTYSEAQSIIDECNGRFIKV